MLSFRTEKSGWIHTGTWRGSIFFPTLWSEVMNQSKAISGWASVRLGELTCSSWHSASLAGQPAPRCAQDQVRAINLCYSGHRHEETRCWMWHYKSQRADAAPWPCNPFCQECLLEEWGDRKYIAATSAECQLRMALPTELNLQIVLTGALRWSCLWGRVLPA